MRKRSMIMGASLAVAVRAAMPHLIIAKLKSDVKTLNAGDYRPLLAGYADDAVLHFNDGPHRWAGSYHGKANIERFFKNFVAAGVQGDLGRLWISGPPWALEFCIRFDSSANSPDGEPIYANRTILWCRTRWGKIVEQRDFYEDTSRLIDLDAKMREFGVPAVT